MRHEETHVSDQDLLRAADGELTTRQIAEIQTHLAACWTCRARMGTGGRVADFVEKHHRRHDSLLPPSDGARAMLKVADGGTGGGVASESMAAIIFAVPRTERTTLARLEARAVPDPNLTPGTTLPVTRDDVCAAGMAETARLVRRP